MSVKYYDNEYRRRELERKEQIMSVFCKDLKGKEKILIIEVLGDKVYGLLHIYDNESTFTYQQNSEKIVTSHGFRYDRYGNLKATFLSLDSNVIESIERKIQGNKSRPKVDDALPVQFFYIDFNKNSNYYFYLY